MNTKDLRKHYDKLTPEERLRLVFAAEQRGDEQERRALMDSAPKVTFAVKHHYGLSEALSDVEEGTLIGTLTLAAQILLLTYYADVGDPEAKVDTLLAHLGAEYLVTLEAWSVIAEEYGVGADDFLTGLRQRLPFLALALDLVGALAEAEAEHAGLEYNADDLVNSLRQEIAERRKRWE